MLDVIHVLGGKRVNQSPEQFPAAPKHARGYRHVFFAGQLLFHREPDRFNNQAVEVELEPVAAPA